VATVRAAAHVFVADLDQPALSDDDARHLGRVMRLRAGEVVTASDGAGRWRACAFADVASLEATADVVCEPAPAPPVTVAFALAKGDRPEWTVQKLTEVGVDRIVPVAAARSVVRLDDDRADRQWARWQKVAREAAMQSRRVWLPTVEPVTPFTSVVNALGAASLAIAEPGGAPPTLERPAVLIGPEGGWSDDELAAADRARLPRVGLGPTVLRAETAAVAAAVLLCGLRSGVVGTNLTNG
jgi:16S rRNA (uracil1498-N3)-methyltransferase